LGYLFDVLIRRLGIGLERSTDVVDGQGRSEEELLGQDDEKESRHDQVATQLDIAAIAKLVRNKAAKLVHRMGAQMKLAAAQKSADPAVLLQLTAVVALLREMRMVEKLPKWREAHERLVSSECEEELLFEVLTYLFGRRYRLFHAIVASLQDERYEELARLKGLLIWLSWDCDVSLDERYGYAEEPENVERRVTDKAVLLEFAQILVGDPLAQEEARNSILTSTGTREQLGAGRWLLNYLRFSELVEQRLASMHKQDRPRRKVQLGALAILPRAQDARLRVVSEVADSNIALVDFCEDDYKIRYEKGSVVSAEE